MKNILAAVFALCLLSLLKVPSCHAVPPFRLGDLPDDGLLDPHAEFIDDAIDPDVGLRFPRVTCSTPWGKLNHAACVTHCIAMNRGYRGGKCRHGVCHCRK